MDDDTLADPGAATMTTIATNGWYDVTSPLAPMPIALDTAQAYISISDADVERIADVVLRKLAKKEQ